MLRATTPSEEGFEPSTASPKGPALPNELHQTDLPLLKDFGCLYKKDFTPVTGIEPAIRRFRRNSPQIGLNTIHSHIFHPITPASEHLPSQCKVSATPQTQSYQGVPREDYVFREPFFRIRGIQRINPPFLEIIQ